MAIFGWFADDVPEKENAEAFPPPRFNLPEFASRAPYLDAGFYRGGLPCPGSLDWLIGRYCFRVMPASIARWVFRCEE